MRRRLEVNGDEDLVRTQCLEVAWILVGFLFNLMAEIGNPQLPGKMRNPLGNGEGCVVKVVPLMDDALRSFKAKGVEGDVIFAHPRTRQLTPGNSSSSAFDCLMVDADLIRCLACGKVGVLGKESNLTAEAPRMCESTKEIISH